MKSELTAIFFEDSKGRGFTTYFAEFPEVIAQGRTRDEASKLLLELLAIALKDKKKQEMKGVAKKNTRSFQLSVSA